MSLFTCPHCGTTTEAEAYDALEAEVERLRGGIQELDEQLDSLLAGIDQDETGSDSGWWETESGAAFGASKLAELHQRLRDLLGKETA